MPDRHAPRPQRRSRDPIGLPPLLLAIALVPIVLTGCGSSSEEDITTKPAAQILATSANAARNAKSVQVTSKIDDGKLKAGLELQFAGQEGGRARTTLGAGSSEVVRIGNTVYEKVDPILARRILRETGTHLPVGSWIQAPVNNGQIAIAAFLTKPDGELALLLRDPTLSLTRGSVTTVNGQKAIELKTRGKVYTGKIYIAATGTPYPIEIVKRPSGGSEEASHTTFTGWNQPIKLQPPPNATQLASLEHKTS